MIGVIVPAHNEEALLDECLASLHRAGRDPKLMGEPVRIAVVLDHCTDASASIAARYPVQTIAVKARNVGLARQVGARQLLAAGARWLAFTDADTVVSPTWLSDQLALGAEAVCGVVTIRDWSEHSPAVRRIYEARYTYGDGHSHVHGANLGVSARAYCMAGGFSALRSHEDVALVDALGMTGATLAWSARPRVYTSARKQGRAVGGFADYLVTLTAAESGDASTPSNASTPCNASALSGVLALSDPAAFRVDALPLADSCAEASPSTAPLVSIAPMASMASEP